MKRSGFRTSIGGEDSSNYDERSWFYSKVSQQEYNENECETNIDQKLTWSLIYLIWQLFIDFRKDIVRLEMGGIDSSHILGRTLLLHMEKNMRELKRVYREETISTSCVKGRVDFLRSAPNISNSIPVLNCKVDTFSINSEHYSALMTAVESLSTVMGTQTDMTNVWDEFNSELAHDARVLRADSGRFLRWIKSCNSTLRSDLLTCPTEKVERNFFLCS